MGILHTLSRGPQHAFRTERDRRVNSHRHERRFGIRCEPNVGRVGMGRIAPPPDDEWALP